ncbi:MAG: hypothetical protein AB7Q17_10020 [Phycisphaerae bacterium]
MCAALVAGCAGRNELTLEQDFAPPAQRQLQLTSTTAFCDDADGRREFLLAFPLPGSADGPRDFLLFLDLPAQPGESVIAPERSDAARGFLIQKVGRFAGKAVLIDGVVTCRRDLLHARRWHVSIAANCNDETRVRGGAWAEPAPHELAAFRRRHTGDLDELAANVRAAPAAPTAADDSDSRESARADPAPAGAAGPTPATRIVAPAGAAAPTDAAVRPDGAASSPGAPAP